MNIAQIEESLRELVETPFDNAVFIYRLLEIYGAPKATVTKLRQANSADNKTSNEVVVKKKLVFRVSSNGKASSAVDDMAGDAKLLKNAPRFLIATDGVEFYAKDIKLDQSLDSSFDTLNDSFDFFLPLAGIERYQGVAENPADIKATARLAKLYDAILEVNPNWRDKEHVHELNQLMTRLLFCFFAEGTSIFGKGQFTNAVMKWSQDDGTDTSQVIGNIFKALSLAASARTSLPEYAKEFPYVMGLKISNRSQSRDYYALHAVLLNFAKINFSNLNTTNQSLAENCLVSDITFDQANLQLVKTYPSFSASGQPNTITFKVDP